MSSSEIANLVHDEERARFRVFDYRDGIDLGEAIRRVAEERNAPVAIDVYAFGQTLYHVCLPGSKPDNERWIERKRAVVLRFHKSSLRVGRELAAEGVSIEERYFIDSKQFSPHGGSFPIRLEGSTGVIGAVSVSGLPQEEDHALVVETIVAFTADR
jgi:uncharacterized protein (UPF0303 family)